KLPFGRDHMEFRASLQMQVKENPAHISTALPAGSLYLSSGQITCNKMRCFSDVGLMVIIPTKTQLCRDTGLRLDDFAEDPPKAPGAAPTVISQDSASGIIDGVTVTP